MDLYALAVAVDAAKDRINTIKAELEREIENARDLYQQFQMAILTGVDGTEAVRQGFLPVDGGSIPTSTLHISHQRIIKERMAEVEPSHPADLRTALVREISRKQAKEIIERYEWLGTMPAYIVKCYGIFFGEHCGGVVVYSQEYAENLGVWDKFGYTGKIICLSRGATLHWTPTNTASKLIRISMRMLPKKYKVITCTVDGTAGEIGTIYQACGFDYVGVMSRGRNASVVLPDGRRLSDRGAYNIYGTRGVKKLCALGLTVVSVPRKARYFAFVGSKEEQEANRKAIEHMIKPYPKRPVVEMPTSPSSQTETSHAA